MTSNQKIWEELTVYRLLPKDQLKPVYKDFTKIIAQNLSHFGFKLQGRKLIKLSNDLIHIIHLDTRGSWTGINDSYEIEIAIVPVCDIEVFIKNYELTGSKNIYQIIPKLKNYHRITQEYVLLADFITRKLIEHILPYFDMYDTTKAILENRDQFELGNIVERNENLILYSELLNHEDKQASKIVKFVLERLDRIYRDKSKVEEIYTSLSNYSLWLKSKDWYKIDNDLQNKREVILKKLKLSAS
ncbi:MAG: hypothetical protein JNJ40_01915 [Bacteroidia bacterium]|nr:hypothetical protein [Bacteroidia bacterium]